MLSFKEKISYGIGGIGDCASYSMIGTFAVFYLTTVVGLNPAMAGTIAAIGAVWQAICGVIAGNISDHTKSKDGKRKPFILASAIPLGLFIALLFNVVDGAPIMQGLYYIVIMILFWTAYTFFFVPYLALGSEITLDYSDRTALRGYAYFFNVIGMLVGVIGPNLAIDYIVRTGGTQEEAWTYCSIIVGCIVAGSIMLMAIKTKPLSEEKLDTDVSKIRERDILLEFKEIISGCSELLKFKPIRLLIFASVFYLLANTFFNAGRMYFFTYNLKLSALEISSVLMCMEISSVILVPTILKLNRSIDKRTLFLYGTSCTVIIIVLLNLLRIDSFFEMCLFIIGYSIGGACYWQLVSSMMYDACEADKLVNKKDRSGLIMSFQALSESLSNAVGLQMLGWILSYAGFEENAVIQSDISLKACEYCAVILPVVFLILTLLMVAKYPITKEIYDRILLALDDRRQGKKLNVEELEILKRKVGCIK